MGILSRRSNKKFTYQPRYSDGDGSSPYEIKHKFDEHRTTVNKRSLLNKFKDALNESKTKTDQSVRTRIYVIIAVLVFLFLWLIDFDLTIFYTQ